MKSKVPSPHFEEKEADRLIAAFGTKPTLETRLDIQDMLKSQKEQFLSNEHSREVRTREGHEKSI